MRCRGRPVGNGICMPHVLGHMAGRCFGEDERLCRLCVCASSLHRTSCNRLAIQCSGHSCHPAKSELAALALRHRHSQSPPALHSTLPRSSAIPRAAARAQRGGWRASRGIGRASTDASHQLLVLLRVDLELGQHKQRKNRKACRRAGAQQEDSSANRSSVQPAAVACLETTRAMVRAAHLSSGRRAS